MFSAVIYNDAVNNYNNNAAVYLLNQAKTFAPFKGTNCVFADGLVAALTNIIGKYFIHEYNFKAGVQMYPLAHLYFMELFIKEPDDAAVLGSVFPDIAILSGLDWRTSHSLGGLIRRHFRDGGEEKNHFSLGVMSHGIEPMGLDYYSDVKFGVFERGYCYEKARPLVDVVIEALSVTPEDGWWKAHNFIEMGVELYIYRQRPELLAGLRTAFSNTELMGSLAAELSPLLKIEEDILFNCFERFKRFAVKEPVDAETLAFRYQRQIYFRHRIESINVSQTSSIIEEGERIILPDIEDFFHYVEGKMASVWPVFL
jgi:hypothetical protein